MSYATVMVSLTVDQSNEAVLEVAGQLAEKFDAKVIGIAAAVLRPPPYFMAGPSFMAGDFAKDFVDQGEASIRKRLSEIEEQFRAGMNGRAKNVEWRCSLELPARYIAREARAADIVVAGRRWRCDRRSVRGGRPQRSGDAGGAAVACSASIGSLAGSAQRARGLEGWRGGEAGYRRRAAALAQGGGGRGAAIAEDENDRSEMLRQADDVVSWLSRHGIQASSMVPERIGNAQIQLDRIAADITAGFVVAGAYGHSRFREWVLGGVTQHLVEQDARCSLLSR